MKTADRHILNNTLDLARKVLQPYPPLTLEQKRNIIKKSYVITHQLKGITPIRQSKILSFVYLLTGEHPIFQSERFLLPNVYHPLHPESYNAFHKIPDLGKATNVHGNNYIYAKTNLRNGVLFTYYDIETRSYLPVTFNTNFPICMVVPDPFCISNGNPVEVITRMLDYFSLLSRKGNLKSFPITFKGLDRKTATLLDKNPHAFKIDHDPDITTISAEVNFPALLYKINNLKTMVKTQKYNINKNKKKPKLLSIVKKLNTLTYCEEWKFDRLQTEYIARKWALSKIARLKRRGMGNIDSKYMMNTVVKSISEKPIGVRNKDYFTIAIKSRQKYRNIAAGQLLGVVLASRNNTGTAALNAVVVPVQKPLRDLGYYTVYKLAEKMSDYGIHSYWHGPKELESDVSAVIEFLGEPHQKEKKYCLKCRIVKPVKTKYYELKDTQTVKWGQTIPA